MCRQLGRFLEREKGFEPSTPALARFGPAESSLCRRPHFHPPDSHPCFASSPGASWRLTSHTQHRPRPSPRPPALLPPHALLSAMSASQPREVGVADGGVELDPEPCGASRCSHRAGPRKATHACLRPRWGQAHRLDPVRSDQGARTCSSRSADVTPPLAGGGAGGGPGGSGWTIGEGGGDVILTTNTPTTATHYRRAEQREKELRPTAQPGRALRHVQVLLLVVVAGGTSAEQRRRLDALRSFRRGGARWAGPGLYPCSPRTSRRTAAVRRSSRTASPGRGAHKCCAVSSHGGSSCSVRAAAFPLISGPVSTLR